MKIIMLLIDYFKTIWIRTNLEGKEKIEDESFFRFLF